MKHLWLQIRQWDAAELRSDVIADNGVVGVDGRRLHSSLDDRHPELQKPLVETHRARLYVEARRQLMDQPRPYRFGSFLGVIATMPRLTTLPIGMTR